MFRRFNKTDNVKVTNASTPGAAALTIVAFAKPTSNGFVFFHSMVESGSGKGLVWRRFGADEVNFFNAGSGTTGVFPAGIIETNEWGIFAVTKASGSVKPDFYYYSFKTETWTKVTGGLNVPDVGAEQGANISFGTFGGGASAEGEYAACTIIDSALSQEAVEGFAEVGFLKDWAGLATLVGFWFFNQREASQPVEDLTENGHDQSEISGTEVKAGAPPIPYAPGELNVLKGGKLSGAKRWVMRGKDFRGIAQDLGVAYLLAPRLATDPLVNLGTVDGVSDAELKNGATLTGAGLRPFHAAANLDGLAGYVQTAWGTRTNLCTTPNPDSALGNWTGSGGFWNNAATVTRDTTDVTPPLSLPACVKVVTSGAAELEGVKCEPGAAVVKAKTYRVAVYVRGAVGGEKIRLGIGNGAVGAQPLESQTLTTEWQRLTWLYTPTESGNAPIGVTNRFEKLAQTFYVAACLVEETETLGDYFPLPADLLTGLAVFSGTSYQSASGIGPLVKGSVRTFVGLASRDTSSSNDSIFGGSSSGDLRLPTSNDVVWRANSTAVTWTGAWPGNGVTVFYALVFDDAANTASLYINGSLVSTQAAAETYADAPGVIRIGAGASFPFDGLVLPFAVSTRELSAEEIERFVPTLIAA